MEGKGLKKKKKKTPSLPSPLVGWRPGRSAAAPEKAAMKKKKKKRSLGGESSVDADYSMASLLDQMSSSMRGQQQQQQPGGPLAETGRSGGGSSSRGHEEEPGSEQAEDKKRKKKSKKRKLLAGGTEEEAPAAAPGPSQSVTQASSAAAAERWGRASEWELWRPDVVAPLDDDGDEGGVSLNLDWAVRTKAMGAAAAAKLVVPRLDARVEVERLEAVRELLAWLKGRAAGLSAASLVAWLQGSKAREGSEGRDPVLPEGEGAGYCGPADVALGQALVAEAGLRPEEAADVCEELGRRAGEAAGRLRALGARRPGGGKKGGAGRWEENGGPPVLRSRHHEPSLYVPLEGLRDRLCLLERNEAVDVSLLKGQQARVNLDHYHKLKALYCPRHALSQLEGRPSSSMAEQQLAEGSEAEAEFHERLGCLLFRYRAWTADGWWAGQRALPARVLDLLWERFNCRLECFSSPLTCRYPRYCSPFWDTDGFFGSVGPFWAFKPLEGAYVAHPPTIDSVVAAMTQHLHGLLTVTSRPLAFVVVLTLSPALSAATRKRLLSAKLNPHLAHQVLVRAGQHGFCQGSQHCERRRHEEEARHDTVVLFLLSKAARASGGSGGGPWAVRAEDEAALRAAFGSYREEDRRDRLGPPPTHLFVKGSSSSSSSSRRADDGDEADPEEA